MKYCEQCGKELRLDAKFCPACGAQIKVESRNVPATRTAQLRHNGSRTSVNISEYLKRCVLLEKNAYIEEQFIDRLKKRIASLGQSTDYDSPWIPRHRAFSFESGDFSLFGTGAILGGIIGLFKGGLVPGALIGGCVLVAICWIFRAIIVIGDNKEMDENYRQQKRNYDAAVAEDKKRVQQELAEKEQLLRILKQAEEKKREITNTLERFYGVDIIFHKYRNLVAVCSLYEYFISGRYSELEGPNGAYNGYETEVRLDRIITKLDVIIHKLDQIKANQYMLFEALSEGNRLTQKLLDESVRQSKLAQKTAQNTAIAAHYSEVAANNAEACAWIGIANYAATKKQ